MQIVGAFLFPHGTPPLNPETMDTSKVPAYQSTTREGCIRIHNAMRKTATALLNTAPDLIIMTTPHGFKVPDTYVIYNDEWISGTAEWNGGWSEFTASIQIDKEVTEYLLRELPKTGAEVDQLTNDPQKHTLSEPLQLRWGEVIPWWFINDEAKKANVSLPKAVIISLPFNMRDAMSANVPAAIKLGNDIYDLLNNAHFLKSKKVAFVISVDLSHNHSKCKTSRYPYLPACEEYDSHPLNWAKLDVNATNFEQSDNELLVKAAALVDNLDSCGYIGLVILQGVFKRIVDSGGELVAHFVEYAVPTYFGMLCSYFLSK
ncbi:hypothetical protein B4U80_13436 [Leptotrombidium deliense]|uniref:Extradiol ring-cleavage dioxygenase class III enzyme subunit B domain-containing protein n=1 Tax=Leptotrombidium deliense TaxID=299467 RepID=A0A443S6Q6_9ACAR|nr:hypothetical protein B4U80_13436 [Leptotrombidium deliense]